MSARAGRGAAGARREPGLVPLDRARPGRRHPGSGRPARGRRAGAARRPAAARRALDVGTFDGFWAFEIERRGGRGGRDRRRAARGGGVAAAVARAARARGRASRACELGRGLRARGRGARLEGRARGLMSVYELSRRGDRRRRSTSPSAARSCSTCATRCGRSSGSRARCAPGGELRLLEPFSPRLTLLGPRRPAAVVRRRRRGRLTGGCRTSPRSAAGCARAGLRDERRLAIDPPAARAAAIAPLAGGVRRPALSASPGCRAGRLTAVIIAKASHTGAATPQIAAFPAPFEGLFSSAIHP